MLGRLTGRCHYANASCSTDSRRTAGPGGHAKLTIRDGGMASFCAETQHDVAYAALLHDLYSSAVATPTGTMKQAAGGTRRVASLPSYAALQAEVMAGRRGSWWTL